MNLPKQLLIGLVLSATAASANEGLYIEGHIGSSWITSSGTKTNIGIFDNSGNFLDQSTSSLNSARDNVLSGGVSAGYDFSKTMNVPVRLELDYSIKGSSDTNRVARVNNFLSNHYSEHINIQNIMANLWLDIETNSAIKPYIGGGLGTAFIKYKRSP